MDASDPDNAVTLVTRNSPWQVVEALLYVGFLWSVTHPEQTEELKDKARTWKNRILHRLSIWQTRGAIQSLPEIDD